MIDMDTGELADLWKDNKEPEFLAISYAIKMAMARLKAQIDSSRVYADIQNLQEDAVDEMAVELCVRGYDQSMPLDVKRNAVATSMLYYTYAGTTKAIRALIQSLYGDAHVDEWFDYDGDPYHFCVGIDITNQLQTVPMLTTDELAEILRGVTRISAHLDDVSFVIRPGLLIGQPVGPVCHRSHVLRCAALRCLSGAAHWRLLRVRRCHHRICIRGDRRQSGSSRNTAVCRSFRTD